MHEAFPIRPYIQSSEYRKYRMHFLSDLTEFSDFLIMKNPNVYY